MTKTVFIGGAAGFGGDRFDASGPLITALSQREGPKYLIFETLAERTLAIAQNQMLRGAGQGYSEFLEEYLSPVLEPCKSAGIKVVTNIGAANVRGAGERIQSLANELGVPDLKVAIVEGDDLLTVLAPDEIAAYQTIEGTRIDAAPIGANVYLGAEPIAEALALGADVVVTGRCTDAALVLGPAIFELGIAANDLEFLAAGTMAGHLLECGPQVTGAYFADPARKPVPDLANVGYPIGEISSEGLVTITKPEGTGGLVSEATVKEQLLYEVHDPGNYLTPDVTLDVTNVKVESPGDNRVTLRGARGKPPPPTLKATVSMDGGFLGEAEMSYAGPGALARAELAVDVLRQRLQRSAVGSSVRFDIIGTCSVFDGDTGNMRARSSFEDEGEYRIRVSARSMDRDELERMTLEVYALWVAGPAGGAGFRKSITPQVKTASILVDRSVPDVRVSMV